MRRAILTFLSCAVLLGGPASHAAAPVVTVETIGRARALDPIQLQVHVVHPIESTVEPVGEASTADDAPNVLLRSIGVKVGESLAGEYSPSATCMFVEKTLAPGERASYPCILYPADKSASR